MTIKRLDHVSVVVDNLVAGIAFLLRSALRAEGETRVQFPWVGRSTGSNVSNQNRAKNRGQDGAR
jgi:hypothetical protein